MTQTTPAAAPPPAPAKHEIRDSQLLCSRITITLDCTSCGHLATGHGDTEDAAKANAVDRALRRRKRPPCPTLGRYRRLKAFL